VFDRAPSVAVRVSEATLRCRLARDVGARCGGCDGVRLMGSVGVSRVLFRHSNAAVPFTVE
jgi:hypothetical protein